MIVLPSPKFPKPQYRRATRPVKARRRVVPAAAPVEVAGVPSHDAEGADGSIIDFKTMRNPLEVDVPQEVERILTTSETPARDLLVMVDDGLLTATEASQALQGTGLNVADVHSAAAFETDRLRAEGLLS